MKRTITEDSLLTIQNFCGNSSPPRWKKTSGNRCSRSQRNWRHLYPENHILSWTKIKLRIKPGTTELKPRSEHFIFFTARELFPTVSDTGNNLFGAHGFEFGMHFRVR